MVWTDELVGTIIVFSVICYVGANLCVGDTGVYSLFNLGQETSTGRINVGNLHSLVADGIRDERHCGDSCLTESSK
ncbi:MAG: hypothetical protein UW94_C0005G0086 [Parcubacteria group bacterium GW2011_GWA2_45_14]|nr:MAG: hypothetical protein UW94_C0005G0086 [Parcubacteria group bacterium GW2011_GWA2_45_14]